MWWAVCAIKNYNHYKALSADIRFLDHQKIYFDYDGSDFSYAAIILESRIRKEEVL